MSRADWAYLFYKEKNMKQLALLLNDMYTLQDEIVDVQQKIYKLENLRDTLFKERKAICTHPLEVRENGNGEHIPRGSRADQFCGVCKKLMSTRKFSLAPTTQNTKG